MSTTPDRTTPPDPPDDLVIQLPRSGVAWDDIQRRILIEALTMAHWVQMDAAALLGLTPRTIGYKMQTLGVQRPPDVKQANRSIVNPRATTHHCALPDTPKPTPARATLREPRDAARGFRSLGASVQRRGAP
jgi:hypothetical protein